ncbi:hypothetical protein [Balneola vulgaris]|uniref:hypothetical protein n=1 Tax=Balneola vulgaris TaxID=287535 RepID=UPI00037D31BE|nr:hypothetical protein [Balneola vulgaris]
MHYPIFNSIVKTVDSNLELRGVFTDKFRTWENNKINATGLELEIELSNFSSFMKSLAINFDWDSFREYSLAKQIKGMESHPILKVEHLKDNEIIPSIDVEMTWLFDDESCQPTLPDLHGNYRVERASLWMENISKQVNNLLAKDDIITRWHVEIEGDENGKYLSAINLISYFQYQITSPKSLNEVNQFVGRRLQDLLVKANKVITLSNDILDKSVAA